MNRQKWKNSLYFSVRKTETVVNVKNDTIVVVFNNQKEQA